MHCIYWTNYIQIIVYNYLCFERRAPPPSKRCISGRTKGFMSSSSFCKRVYVACAIDLCWSKGMCGPRALNDSWRTRLFAPSYYLAPPPPSPPARPATHRKSEKERQIADGRGGRGWRRSQIIRRRESLVLYCINHSTLSGPTQLLSEWFIFIFSIL